MNELVEKIRRAGGRDADPVLQVDVAAQTLCWGAERWAVSTSRFGLGCETDSGRTPAGLHRIGDRIGADAPLGAVFVSREPTGEVIPPAEWNRETDEDRILTRILRLEGGEPHNRNSYDRYIYLHGTNQEQLLGAPASMGCIRLGNRAIADLFERLGSAPAWVWIA